MFIVLSLGACQAGINQSPEELGPTETQIPTETTGGTTESTNDVVEATDITQDATTEEAPQCALENVDLNEFEAWRREAGWWVGEYTLLGADGNPSVSQSWPYRYDHYKGFIHLEVEGNAIKQRNVFLYPPKLAEECSGEDVFAH